MKRATYFLAVGVIAFCLAPVFAASHHGGSGHSAPSHAAAHGGAASHAGVGHASGVARGGVNHGGYYGHDRFGRGYGYGGYGYGGYGYWPGWLGWGYYDSPYLGYYDSPYYGYGNDYYPPAVYPPAYANVPQPAVAANDAVLEVIVPDPQAHVWINGSPTTTTGADRTYVTTPPAGSTIPYTVRATWNQNGKEVAAERQIQVIPGRTNRIEFDAQPTSNPVPNP